MDLQAISDRIGSKITVIGNLPYGISSQILIKLIQSRSVVDRTILMFQKELAQRITAQPGGRDYGRITAMLRYCADIRILANIKPSVFYPPPKVDSMVIETRFKSTAMYGPHDETMLFAVIKAAFGNRRKTLKNALTASGFGIDSKTALNALGSADIDPTRRAETLKPAEFVTLETCLRKAIAKREG
jgi:16S rRNA (adenine1518-N6/adenine1519-N6)-dimethyltransferase